MSHYMIHCCNDRLHYVTKYLIPSMCEQGIARSDIEIWLDTENEGNLISCLKSMLSLSDEGYTWHLQDDVIISPDFREVTESISEGIACGFCSLHSKIFPAGYVTADKMWYSFPCIGMINKLAKAFALWVYSVTPTDARYKNWSKMNKFDDSFFREFMQYNHNKDMKILNISPNIVDHIDYLIGGSKVNSIRSERVRSIYWNHDELIAILKEKIQNDRNFKK